MGIRLSRQQISLEHRRHLSGEVAAVDIQARFVIELNRTNVEVG
jgi:hypothetical protein